MILSAAAQYDTVSHPEPFLSSFAHAQDLFFSRKKKEEHKNN